MKVIILAGGGGTRLFPLSRTCFPKQFLRLNYEYSLLAQTVNRFKKLVKPSDMIVVTNQEYLHHVRAELAAVGAKNAHILLEPVTRNTAPAVALAVRYCLDELKCSPQDAIIVSPSDLLISQTEFFFQAIHQASHAVSEPVIVTFGIKPEEAKVGYGYIELGQEISPGLYSVCSFKEKPDLATAVQYLNKGNYYWNSGIFVFTCQRILEELALYAPNIADLANLPFNTLLQRFAEMPDISLDYAVAEKSNRLTMIPLQADWHDIGSWDAIYEVMDKDKAGNALSGDCLTLDCKNTLIMGKSRLIAGIGLEDLLVVETDDVILVAKQGESHKVRDLVRDLNAKGRKEAYEATTMYRPWGSYTVLGEGPGYKMKKIVVNPGQSLSLQLHYHRSEHWIVINGTAQVTIGDEVHMIHENSSIFVPQSTKHRLKNPGRIPLEIIEVQNGAYLGEDDIVRFDDIYGRS